MNFEFVGYYNPQEISVSLLTISTIESVFEQFVLKMIRTPTNFLCVNLSLSIISKDQLQTFLDKLNNREDCRLSFQNDVIFIMVFDVNNDNESRPHRLTVDCNMRYGLFSTLKFDLDDNDFERMKIMFNSIIDYYTIIYDYYDLLCAQEEAERRQHEDQQENGNNSLSNYIGNNND